MVKLLNVSVSGRDNVFRVPLHRCLFHLAKSRRSLTNSGSSSKLLLPPCSPQTGTLQPLSRTSSTASRTVPEVGKHLPPVFIRIILCFLVGGRSSRACLIAVDGQRCRVCCRRCLGTLQPLPGRDTQPEVEHRARTLTVARSTSSTSVRLLRLTCGCVYWSR
jgi:hypothetical protein